MIEVTDAEGDGASTARLSENRDDERRVESALLISLQLQAGLVSE